MLLRRLQDFLESHGQACLSDIAAHLQVDQAAVQGMLEELQRRGRVQRIEMNARLCAGCTRCAPDARVEWRWLGSGLNKDVDASGKCARCQRSFVRRQYLLVSSRTKGR